MNTHLIGAVEHEFDSAPGDLVLPEFVLQLAHEQDGKIKAGMDG